MFLFLCVLTSTFLIIKETSNRLSSSPLDLADDKPALEDRHLLFSWKPDHNALLALYSGFLVIIRLELPAIMFAQHTQELFFFYSQNSLLSVESNTLFAAHTHSQHRFHLRWD